ncbi:MAG TPA: TraB/GumN family protein [Rhabdochlamydiaceae bacterium]|nr:TraB/GumN family protein [Rhabdochlamydiaceae bacterium]
MKAREYPEWVLEEIQNCDLLVSEFDKELITGDPRTNAWQRTAENLLIIQKKLFDFDEEWFKVHLTKLGYNHEVIESVISMLKEKRDELKRDQTNWQSQLSEEAQMQIQQHLNGYELRLANVDPFFVESSLGYASGAEDTDIDTNTGEIVILQNFQDRNRPIINLESLDGALLMYLEEFLNDISSYSLEGSLEGIQNLLIGNVKEKTSAENYIRLANGKIVCDPAEFKESLKKDDDDDATPALVYRNIQGVPKIISAINQKKDTAITVGAQHLMGSTGLIQSLEQKGYCVEHVVKFCKE